MYIKLLHIKKNNGEPFITEEDIRQIQSEENLGKSDKTVAEENKLSNAYHTYILNTKTPEQILKRHWENREQRLKEMFEGTEVDSYKFPEGTLDETVEKTIQQLEDTDCSRRFVPFTDKQGGQFLIEKRLAQPANLNRLVLFHNRYINMPLLKVG